MQRKQRLRNKEISYTDRDVPRNMEEQGCRDLALLVIMGSTVHASLKHLMRREGSPVNGANSNNEKRECGSARNR